MKFARPLLWPTLGGALGLNAPAVAQVRGRDQARADFRRGGFQTRPYPTPSAHTKL